MAAPCPKCGADTSQSSGVVCPECGYILQPGADNLVHERLVPMSGRRGRFALAFLIPFSLGSLCLIVPGGNVPAGLACGTLLGLMFLGCYALASRRTSTALGQAIGAFLLFLGVMAVIVGVVFAGCALAYGGGIE